MALANLHIKTPDSFDFKNLTTGPNGKKCFEQFRVAAGLNKEEEPRQVSTLLYCLGEEADDVLSSTNVTDEDRKKYATIIVKFDAFFQVRKNVILKRAKFNRRNQKTGRISQAVYYCPLQSRRLVQVWYSKRGDVARPNHHGDPRYRIVREPATDGRSNAGVGQEKSATERSCLRAGTAAVW